MELKRRRNWKKGVHWSWSNISFTHTHIKNKLNVYNEFYKHSTYLKEINHENRPLVYILHSTDFNGYIFIYNLQHLKPFHQQSMIYTWAKSSIYKKGNPPPIWSFVESWYFCTLQNHICLWLQGGIFRPWMNKRCSTLEHLVILFLKLITSCQPILFKNGLYMAEKKKKMTFWYFRNHLLLSHFFTILYKYVNLS